MSGSRGEVIPEPEERHSLVKEPGVSLPSGSCPVCLTEVAARHLLAKEPALISMSLDFFLQPLDGGPRVPVGPGQTVIGRGPLLGVSAGGAPGRGQPEVARLRLLCLALLVKILQFGGSTVSLNLSQLTDFFFWCLKKVLNVLTS